MPEVELDGGELVTIESVDGLIAELTDLKDQQHKIRGREMQLRTLLAALAEGDQKTRYVRGESRRVKVVSPPDYWDQSELKEVWHAYPRVASQVMRVERLAVNMREWKKVQKESGPPDFQLCRDMIAAANKGPRGVATVTEVEL